MTAKVYPILEPVPNEANEPIPGGFYLKARCIQDSAIAVAPPHVREIWDWILKEANHKDMKTHGKTILRGQLLTDYKEIQEGLQWYVGYVRKGYEKHHVDYAMRWLRQEQMITTHKTTRGLIITICKYDRYQTIANYENAYDYDNQKTIKRQSTDRINKNVKNDKNVKELVAGADAPKQKTFKQWDDQEFIAEIAKYKEFYSRDLLNAFFKYWSEKSASGKMKFQLERTWETDKRMQNWQRIEETKK